MGLSIEIVAPDGAVQRLPVSGGPTRFEASAGQRFRLINDDGGVVAINATVRRVDDDLVMDSEAERIDLTIEGFFTTCAADADRCALSISELGGAPGATVTPASEPIVAVSQGGFLLWASPGLGTVIPEARDSEFPWRPVAGIGAGLLLIGGTAGGGGGDSAVAADSTPPAAPVIRTDLTTNETKPVISGTAEPGTTVRVTIDIGTSGQRVTFQAAASASGEWSIDTGAQAPFSGTMPAAGLPGDVPSTVRAIAVDASGNSSAIAVGSIQIDTSAPAERASVTEVRSNVPTPLDADGEPASSPTLNIAPGIVADGGATNDDSPTINGNIDAPLSDGDRVVVLRDGVAIGFAVVTGQDWTFADATVPAGRHVYTAQVVDRAGNAAPAGAGITVTVDGTPPVAPTIDIVSVDDRITAADAQQPIIVTGSGEAGTRVTVAWGAVTQTGNVGADGRWSITFDGTTLPGNGVRAITVVGTDAFGNHSAATSRPVIVSTGLPAAPVIDTSAGSVLGGPVAAINAAEASAGVQIGGTADAGNSVTVTFTPLNGGAPIGIVVVAGADGRFVANFPAGSLPQGTYAVRATAIDGVGNTTQGPIVEVLVDTVAPTGTAIIGSVTGNEGNATVVASGGAINDASPTLSGTARSGSAGDVVIISRDGAVIGTAAIAAGQWNFTDRAVPDGQHVYSAIVADAAGNRGPAGGQSFVLVVDTVAPAAPSINAVAGDDIVTSTELAGGIVVSGRGEAGSVVRVDWAGQARNVTVDGAGNWSVRYTSPPADGRTQVTATVTDAAGNETSAFRVVVVDTQPPAAPTIGVVAGNDFIDANEAGAGIVVSGRAEAGTAINVVWAGQTATAATSAAGFWTVTFAAPPAQGTSTITVTARDSGNNVSAPASRQVVVDTAAPAAPVIDPVEGDNIVTLNEAADGVTITGRGEAGTTVTVDWAGATRTATVDSNGRWAVSYTTPPAQGVTPLRVVATDGAGNASSAAVASVTVDTVDRTPPPVPTIAVVEGDDRITVAEAANGVPVSGTAEAGATIVVTWAGLSATTTASGSGAWTVNFATTPAPGDAPITVVARDAAGNESTAASRTVTVVAAPVVVPPPNIGIVEGDDRITVAEAADGVPVSGTALAGATIIVSWAGLSATTTASASGAWTVSFDTTPAPGTASIIAVARDAAGNESIAGSRTVTVVAAPIVVPPPSITVVEGDDVIDAAEAANGVAVSGTAAAGTTVVVSWGSLTATATTAAGGTWNVNFAAPPGEGPSTINAVARDAAGNQSVNASRPVTVDTTPELPPPPAAPIFSTVAGDDIVNIAEAQAGVTITGSAEANASVVVTWGTASATTTASATGAWSAAFTPTQVPVATAALSAVASNTGGPSPAATAAVTIDRAAPTAATIGIVEGDNIITAAEAADGVQMSGTAEADSQVVISWNGVSETTTTSGAGAWQVSFDNSAPPGTYTVTATIRDAAGNVGPAASGSVVVAPAADDEGSGSTAGSSVVVLSSADLLDDRPSLFDGTPVAPGSVPLHADPVPGTGAMASGPGMGVTSGNELPVAGVLLTAGVVPGTLLDPSSIQSSAI